MGESVAHWATEDGTEELYGSVAGLGR